MLESLSIQSNSHDKVCRESIGFGVLNLIFNVSPIYMSSYATLELFAEV